jgi:hypothetical protein
MYYLVCADKYEHTRLVIKAKLNIERYAQLKIVSSLGLVLV